MLPRPHFICASRNWMHKASAVVMVLLFLLAGSAASGQQVNWARQMEQECPICQGQLADVEQTSVPVKNYHELHRALRERDQEKAMPLLLYGINHLEQYNQKQQFYLLVSLSNSYQQKGLIDKVHEVQQKSLDLSTDSLDVPTSAVFANTGHYLFETGQYEEALQVYQTVVDRGTTQQNEVLFARVLNNMGICYFHKDSVEFEKADSCLALAVASAQSRKDTLQVCQFQTNVGDLRFDQYRDAEAEAIWLAMARLAESQNYLNEQEIIFGNLAFFYQEGEHWQQALAYSQKRNKVQQAMWDRDQLWKQAESEKKYELGLKQAKIDLVSSENERKTLQRNALIVISVLVLMVGLVFVWLYRSKRRANRVIMAQNTELTELNTTKDKLFSIISHDLRSPILSLKNRSGKMVRQLNTDADQGSLELARANHNSLHRMHQLIENVLSWGVSQQEKREPNFQKLDLSRVVDMVTADYGGLMEDKQLTLESEVKNRSFVSADLHNLKAVLRNVMDNAIKNNASGGSIRFSMPESTNTLWVENDGEPIPMDIVHEFRSGKRGKHLASSGLGLWICNDLMELNQGSFDILPTDTGTRVIITFKPTADD